MKRIFSSNYLDGLAKNLKEELFFQKNDVFSKYIFIPNQSLKNWILKRFADDQDLQGSFGLNFVTMQNFEIFFQNLLNVEKDKRFSSNLELSLYIEKKLYHILDNNNDSCFIDLRKYLEYSKPITSKASERISTLSGEIANLFINYGLHKIEIPEDNWQKKLFDEIFIKDKKTYPFRDFSYDTRSLQKLSFHFFGIDYIPRVYLDFLSTIDDVNFYFLSPCKMFWEDICSDYEIRSIRKFWKVKGADENKRKDLDSYLKDRNQYLANMGRLKRSFLKFLSDFELDLKEDYIEPNSLSLLSIFQKDMLYLENSMHKPVEKDHSIQIHICSSKLREIEVLKNNILTLLDQYEDIKLSDIQIVAPNIEEYYPYVQMVFEDNLKYRISDLKLANQSSLIFGIQKLFSLAESNFEKHDIFDFFENESFRNKYNLTLSDIAAFSKWIQRANVDWGIDDEHIHHLIGDNENYNIKSFDYGMNRVLQSLTFIMNDTEMAQEFKYDHPLEGFDMSSSELLDKFINVFKKLKEDVFFIVQNPKLTLVEFCEYIKKIIDSYFAVLEDGKEKKAYTSILSFLENLQKIEARFNNFKYSLNTLFRHLTAYLNTKETLINKNELESLSFLSFKSLSYSSKIVYLIGMNDEFPKVMPQNSLDLLNCNLLKRDKIRNQFFQSILFAKDYLFLSYNRNDQNDKSLYLCELLSYLDFSYSFKDQKISDYITFTHSAVSFHKSNFSKKNINTTNLNYLAAKAFYQKKKPLSLSFIDYEKKEIDQEYPEIIHIEDLISLAKNPIKFYIRKVLGVFLENKKTNEKLELSYLDKYIFKQASIKQPIEKLLYISEKQGKMPHGIFHDIAKLEMKEEIDVLYQNLSKFNLKKENIFKLELRDSVDNLTQVSDRLYQAPSINLTIDDKSIKLVGSLKNVSKQAFISHSDDKLPNLIKYWPEILIYLQFQSSFSNKVIFTKTLKEKNFDIEDSITYLKKYIRYYLRCLSEPSPLLTDWTTSILKEDVSSLEKAMERSKEENPFFEDIYFNFAFLKKQRTDAKIIHDKWSKYLMPIFKPILEKK